MKSFLDIYREYEKELPTRELKRSAQNYMFGIMSSEIPQNKYKSCMEVLRNCMKIYENYPKGGENND